jgi:hypothetical protein
LFDIVEVEPKALFIHAESFYGGYTLFHRNLKEIKQLQIHRKLKEIGQLWLYMVVVAY